MGIIGFLVQVITAGFVGYLGYTHQIQYEVLAACPLGFMFGAFLSRSGRSSGGAPQHGFFAMIGNLITSYIIFAVATAICFGAGWVGVNALDLRPPEGAGRI